MVINKISNVFSIRKTLCTLIKQNEDFVNNMLDHMTIVNEIDVFE